jgi:mannose-6-phosphate isomerase-like protein (cupin superfamily)
MTRGRIVRLEDLDKQPLNDGMGHVEGQFWEVFTARTAGTEALRLLVQEYPPGGHTSGHPVHNDFEQTYYVLAGTLTMTLDGEEFSVPEGSFVFIPRGTPHEHRNDGSVPMRFLTINTPVRDGGVPALPERTRP